MCHFEMMHASCVWYNFSPDLVMLGDEQTLQLGTEARSKQKTKTPMLKRMVCGRYWTGQGQRLFVERGHG